MRKNLLIVHLESISRANLWQYRAELGTVWRLMSSSLQFTRFFTNSTSTEMTANDLVYGDSSAKDASPTFQASKKYHDRLKFDSLFNDFTLQGYRFLWYGTSPYSQKRDVGADNRRLVNDPNVPAVCEKALSHMAAAKEADRPFAAYFWDDSSHLAYPSPIKEKADSVAGKLRAAYALVDSSLNRLLAGMAELGLWENTVIVGFGDHGDEAWSHGLNRGYCHSIPPYASVTWTPMFIYDQGRFEGGMNSQLGSVIDLKPTLWSLLLPDLPPLQKLSPFAGIDLFNEKRDLAFSQNMFALQREQSDPEKGMIKGYAVTDGNYRLVASSGGDEPVNGGMELYCDQADPANSLNLLRLFKLDRHGEIKRFVPPAEAAAKHFTSVFGQSQIDSLIAAFNKLKPSLVRFIKEKESEALMAYQTILDTPADELAARQEKSYLRQVPNSTTPTQVFLDEANSLKAAFAKTAPQLFPDQAFIQAKKAT